MESRIRGDVYVRFGGECLETCYSDITRRRVLTLPAANMRLVEHYKDKFKAEHIGMLHPYQILIDESSAKNIMEVYDYEETNLELL